MRHVAALDRVGHDIPNAPKRQRRDAPRVCPLTGVQVPSGGLVRCRGVPPCAGVDPVITSVAHRRFLVPIGAGPISLG